MGWKVDFWTSFMHLQIKKNAKKELWKYVGLVGNEVMLMFRWYFTVNVYFIFVSLILFLLIVWSSSEKLWLAATDEIEESKYLWQSSRNLGQPVGIMDRQHPAEFVADNDEDYLVWDHRENVLRDYPSTTLLFCICEKFPWKITCTYLIYFKEIAL